jgi:uncharacterized membrane protein (UPF0127 family)
LLFNLAFPVFIAGTSGSYFFGFILATLAVVAGTKIATLMLVIIFPLIDAVWVIFDRIKSGQSIFIGDKKSRHLHYRLLKLGWSEKKIVFSYTLFLAIILAIDFYLGNRNFKLLLLILEIGIINYFMFLVLVALGLILAFYFRIFDSKKENSNVENGWVFSQSFNYEKLIDEDEVNLKIGEHILQTRILKSGDKKYEGLSGEDALGENEGVLFVFPESDEYAFVMRDMKIDLDFIFINNGKIIKVIKNIPSDYEEILKAENPYNAVVETNAGWLDQHEINIGEKVFMGSQDS